MDTAGKTVNKKAAAWTVGVHVVLLFIFLFFTFSTPVVDKPVQELGMEVNLGTSDNGSGHEQPMNTEDPAEAKASVAYKPSASEKSETKEILRTEDKDAPAVNTPATKSSNNINRAETEKSRSRNSRQQAAGTTNAQPQRPKYVYQGGTGKGGNSAAANAPGNNEGNTTGSGDPGVPGGTPGAPNYTGTPGMGNGISHTLNRRNIIAFPPPDADFKEGGKVVIRITVNRAGAITNKQVVSASNAELRAIAIRKLDKVKFNKSEEAPEEQFGNITFVFKTRS
jgi:hypothetical protein